MEHARENDEKGSARDRSEHVHLVRTLQAYEVLWLRAAKEAQAREQDRQI